MSKDEPANGGPRKERHKTMQGYGPPKSRTDAPLDPEPAKFEKEAAPVVSRPDVSAPIEPAPIEPVPHARAGGEREVRRTRQPAVDIDLIHERRTAPLPDQQWVFVEIWTRNTIYALDSRLVCVDVVDQNSRRSHPDHALLGARLVGGQRREGEAMELSHPFPRPGSEAVFEQSKGRQVRFSQTSSVTRVVMRLRVLTVSSDNLLPAWEEITGSHPIVKPPS